MQFISQSFREFSAIADQNLPAIRSSLDVEAIHDFRVALRELRSILRYTSSFLQPEFAGWLKAECGWVDDAFAALRNTQVLLARFNQYPEELKSVGALDKETLEANLASESAEFKIFLTSPRFLQFISTIAESDVQTKIAVDGARAVRKDLKSINKELWKKFKKQMKNNSHAELHKLRIMAKRVHYLAMASEPVLGSSIRKHGELAAKIQKIQGELQDSVIMHESIQTDEIRAYELETQARILKSWDRFVSSNRKRW